MTTYTLDDVLKRLAEFYDESEIAAQFAVLGIQGNPDCGHSCPIANLVSGVCDDEGDPDAISVCAQEIVFMDENRAMPHVAGNFVRRFDRWDFPELIEGR